MTTEEIEELKQLIALQREMTRQRLRTATCEAWVDDVQQKMAINRAVYAAGYGIAPKQPDDSKAQASVSVDVQSPTPANPPATVPASLAAKLAPWAILAASLLGVGGLGSAAWYASRSSVTPPAAAPVDFPLYDVQAWKPPAAR